MRLLVFPYNSRPAADHLDRLRAHKLYNMGVYTVQTTTKKKKKK